MKVLACVCLLTYICGSNSLIVPDEVPSLLSVIYSNIPTLKKGTDSRIAWGFRLGNRADLQVITELGPQTYTQPLGNQGDKNTNKRDVIDTPANVLYAQRQHEKKISDTEGRRWIDSWSKDVKSAKQVPVVPAGAEPGLGIGEVDAKSVIPDDAVLALEKLLRGGVQYKPTEKAPSVVGITKEV